MLRYGFGGVEDAPVDYACDDKRTARLGSEKFPAQRRRQTADQGSPPEYSLNPGAIRYFGCSPELRRKELQRLQQQRPLCESGLDVSGAPLVLPVNRPRRSTCPCLRTSPAAESTTSLSRPVRGALLPREGFALGTRTCWTIDHLAGCHKATLDHEHRCCFALPQAQGQTSWLDHRSLSRASRIRHRTPDHISPAARSVGSPLWRANVGSPNRRIS
ncbi:hypothetical protein C8Q73DRAFT_377939 [Cubamyces lactineus]|nr:hypothetical protein C8Q73DRAFT_377939 [Cubamyces lactineus]